MSRAGSGSAVVALLAAMLIGAFPARGAVDTVADGLIAHTVHNGRGGFAIRGADPVTGAEKWLAAGSAPAWSPDGRRLAFVGNNGYIRIRNADGSVTWTGVRALGFGRFSGGSMAWSPNGRRLAYTANSVQTQIWEIWVMNVTRPYKPRQITYGGGLMPSWAPDSRRIVYAGVGVPNPDHNYGDLHVVNADGTGDRNVTRTPARHESNPEWSPDGSSFTYIGAPDSAGGIGIFRSRSDGTGARQIKQVPEEARISLSPTGTQIAVRWASALWVMNADGTNERYVMFAPPEETNIATPIDWQPRVIN